VRLYRFGVIFSTHVSTTHRAQGVFNVAVLHPWSAQPPSSPASTPRTPPRPAHPPARPQVQEERAEGLRAALAAAEAAAEEARAYRAKVGGCQGAESQESGVQAAREVSQ
jgi:hypothetical protein